MKTALQELIEYVDNPMKSNAISKLELVFYLKNTLLEKEKEQIINATCLGKYNNIDDRQKGEEYYNQTYNQEETLEEWKSKFTLHCAIKPKNK